MDVEIRNTAHGYKTCRGQGALKLKVRGCKWRRGNGAGVRTQKPPRTPTGLTLEPASPAAPDREEQKNIIK